MHMIASPYNSNAGISGWGPSGPPANVKQYWTQELPQGSAGKSSSSKGGAGSTDSVSYFQKLLSMGTTSGAAGEAASYGPEVSAAASALGSSGAGAAAGGMGAGAGAATGSY
jgi:hypothetical protein